MTGLVQSADITPGSSGIFLFIFFIHLGSGIFWPEDLLVVRRDFLLEFIRDHVGIYQIEARQDEIKLQIMVKPSLLTV